VVFISLSKHPRKDFQVIIAFGHRALVTSQSLFEYGVEKILSFTNIQQISAIQHGELF